MSWLWSLLALGCVACAAGVPSASTSHHTAQPRLQPAPLLAPSAIGYDFQWRQRVTAHWPSGDQSFEAVLQKRAGELILVGLSPLGLPGFVLRLRADGQLEVENRTGRELPFEPGFVLSDVQRVFFPWLPAPAADYTGELHGSLGPSLIVERYERGSLAVRRFERQTALGLERVSVRYGGHTAGRDAPAHAAIDNPLLHYRLEIETFEQERLGP